MHHRIYFSGDWDVHWGYDLDFDPYGHLGCTLMQVGIKAVVRIMSVSVLGPGSTVGSLLKWELETHNELNNSHLSLETMGDLSK